MTGNSSYTLISIIGLMLTYYLVSVLAGWVREWKWAQALGLWLAVTFGMMMFLQVGSTAFLSCLKRWIADVLCILILAVPPFLAVLIVKRRMGDPIWVNAGKTSMALVLGASLPGFYMYRCLTETIYYPLGADVCYGAHLILVLWAALAGVAVATSKNKCALAVTCSFLALWGLWVVPSW